MEDMIVEKLQSAIGSSWRAYRHPITFTNREVYIETPVYDSELDAQEDMLAMKKKICKVMDYFSEKGYLEVYSFIENKPIQTKNGIKYEMYIVYA